MVLGWLLWLSQVQAAEPLPPPPPPPPGVETPAPDAVSPPPDAPGVALPPTPTQAPVSTPPAAEQTPQTNAESPPADVAPPRVWYGYQTLAIDALALGSIVGVAAATRDKAALLAVVVPAALVYDFGPPTVHWFQRDKRTAFISFGLRLGVPLVSLLVAPAFGGCNSPDTDAAQRCRNRANGIGAAVGLGIVPFIDAAWLGWKPGRKTSSFQLAPALSLSTSSASVALGGAF